ncbi:hypothetical protein QAD02_004025 [Eretmocerus hayati]|uniref:Uncharacterized protein n=1 Tax=Eretmocerus hayati TaxID=131215 RepID=A0ACC2NT90_9HYME|nr:hypothetical protein QAD02_004025 [Eretmocerus hayati]
MTSKVFLVFIVLAVLNLCECNFEEKERILRQNLLDLFQGKLKYNDESTPSYEEEFEDTTPSNRSEYDFIIIGAGTAGATIASRLSENEGTTVLLIEAGSKEYPIMDVPLIAAALQMSDEINWRYQTEPSNEYCLGFIDKKCNWPRGKVMGGSSVLNVMIATRGNRRDFDEWAEMTGDKSWSYKEMLRYLKKLENFTVTGIEVDDKLHNQGGPVSITHVPYRSTLAETFIRAGKELGYPEVDYNGAEQIGFSLFHTTTKNGERWSTNRAYLHPAKNRKNLLLTRNSHVNKILINKDTKSAYGVQFSKFDKVYEVMAKKEIILSAGAINSPQILMLSGIGPKKHLQSLNVDVIKDAPVGENLMDHIGYPGIMFTLNDSSTFKPFNLFSPEEPSIKDYVRSRTGRLTTTAAFEALAYLNVDSSDPKDKDPNIELMFASVGPIKDPIFMEILGVNYENRAQLMSEPLLQSAWTAIPMIMRPKSRGRLLLRSSNPKDKPKLFANYLSEPDDIRVLIKGIRSAIRVSKTKTFGKYGSSLYRIPLPLCDDMTFNSDDYWECALRTYTGTIYHYAGTCKMGSENDTSSVVDSKLQVIGINGLRVADASIMPKIVSAHPNIPIIAIGEKISDMIKEDWNLNDQSRFVMKTSEDFDSLQTCSNTKDSS